MLDNPFAEFNLEKAIDLRWTLRDIQAGRIKMDVFTPNVYPLDKINQALNDLEAGKIVRPLIDMKA